MGLLSRLARDYGRALRRGINAEVKRDLLDMPHVNTNEYATYAGRRQYMDPVMGGEYSVNAGPIPYGLRGEIYGHHTHPADFADDVPLPLSLDDLQWLNRNRASVKGTFAHEARGGGSYAERGPKMGAGWTKPRAWHALEKGAKMAEERFGDTTEQLGASMIPVGRAAKRVGILRRYGYQPSNADQEMTLASLEPALEKAEWDILRAMHGEIYGLPHPLTWGRLGLAAAGGYGLYDALA